MQRYVPAGMSTPSEKVKSFRATRINDTVDCVSAGKATHWMASLTAAHGIDSERLSKEGINLGHVIDGRLGPTVLLHSRADFFAKRTCVLWVCSHVVQSVGKGLAG
jgi:hypothetical protein